MRHFRCTEINGIRFLLFVAPVLIALLCSACGVQNIREHPDYLYRGYDGPNLPRQEVATVPADFLVDRDGII